MNKEGIILLFWFNLFFSILNGQTFINSDLNGSATTALSILPFSWTNVPYTDPVCLASNANNATPDLTSSSGPDLANGVSGYPYSGNTFVSGVQAKYSFTGQYHEGIQQSVSGLTIGKNYFITFFQAVVKQPNCLDTSGSWIVYGDNNLLGISEPSTSNLAYDSLLLQWEKRSIEFTAVNTTTTFKFLPWDDDSDINNSYTNLDGALRMGIDSIFLTPCSSFQLDFTLGNDIIMCPEDNALLDATYSNSTYLWQDGSTDSTYNVSIPGLYWVEVQHLCDTVRDSIRVDINPSLNLNLGSDTVLCQGTSILLEASSSSVGDYLWQDNSSGVQYLVEEAGIFWVELSNACETIRDSIEIDYYEDLSLDLGEDVVLCPGEIIELDATVSNAISYIWSDNSTNTTFEVFDQNMYQVTVNTPCGILEDSIYVTYQAPINLDLGNDTTLCSNEVLLLEAIFNNVTYQWQDGSTLPYYNVTQPGTYMVDVSINNCVENDQIVVNYFPHQSLDLGEDYLLCKEKETVVLKPNLSGNYYLWSTGSIEPSIEALPFGKYSLEMVDNYGCILRDSVMVTYNEPKVDLMDDQEICLGETLLIYAQSENVKEYLWSTGSKDSFINISTPDLVSVMIVDSNDCRAWDSLQISLGGCHLYIPNSFTPNGDLLNDIFKAEGENINFFEMSVFNRYGEEIFFSDHLDKGWDGNKKGKPSPMGIYSYKVLFQNTVSKDFISRVGYVALVR